MCCTCHISIWRCRDAASAELELDQLQEVQLAFQKMDIYSGAGENIYQSLAQAMGWLMQWLKDKADGTCLSSKGYERFEGVWAGHQVVSHKVMHRTLITAETPCIQHVSW